MSFVEKYIVNRKVAALFLYTKTQCLRLSFSINVLDCHPKSSRAIFLQSNTPWLRLFIKFSTKEYDCHPKGSRAIFVH